MKLYHPSLLKILLAFCLLTVVFSGCKRGDEDPLISFRSRKARIAGKWHLTELVTNGLKIELIVKTIFIIRKDGTAERIDTDVNGVEHTIAYRWNFLGSEAESKDKERMILYSENTSEGVIYTLRMLKHKKMLWRTQFTDVRSLTFVNDYTYEAE